MKRLLTLILTALCLSPLPLAAQAYKSAPVTVSQVKVSKDGKDYLVHAVMDHQTLFSISRAYGVTYQDILDANPELDLSRGQIQVGQTLLIPVVSETAEAAAAPASAAPSAPAGTPAAQGDGFTSYTVKWYEDLDMIAAKFNVPKETLMAVNGMKTDQVTRRQKLRIPVNPDAVTPADYPAGAPEAAPGEPATGNETAEAFPETGEASDPDAGTGLGERIGFSLRDLFRKKRDSDKIAVGVILPFNAKGQPSHSAFDLYSGMLLAVRDLAKGGTQAELTVMDSKNPATDLGADRLQGFDLVIGPVDPEELERVLEQCPRSTAVVSPLDPKAVSLTAGYPNLIQAPSPSDAQFRDLVAWVREDALPADKILLVGEKDIDTATLEEQLNAAGLHYETFRYGVSESRSVSNTLKGLLSSNGTVRVILAVEKEGYANEAVRTVALTNFSKARAILYAPSRLRTYDMVETEHLHLANTHLSCSYFIDYDNPRIKDFLLSYRALFGSEPTQFAYQGYDIGWYFIRNFSTGERERERMTRLEDRKYTGLQSDFLITDGDEGGHVNRAVRRVIYKPDYSITLSR